MRKIMYIHTILIFDLRKYNKILFILFFCLLNIAYSQVFMTPYYCEEIPTELAIEDALIELNKYCAIVGGENKGNLKRTVKGIQEVCISCYICNSDFILDSLQTLQVACEEQCGEFTGTPSNSCFEGGGMTFLLQNRCDRSKKYINEYPQCQEENSSSSDKGGFSSSSGKGDNGCFGVGSTCPESSNSGGGSCVCTYPYLSSGYIAK